MEKYSILSLNDSMERSFIHHKTVGKSRLEKEENNSILGKFPSMERTYITKHGTPSIMKTERLKNYTL